MAGDRPAVADTKSLRKLYMTLAWPARVRDDNLHRSLGHAPSIGASPFRAHDFGLRSAIASTAVHEDFDVPAPFKRLGQKTCQVGLSLGHNDIYPPIA